MSRIFLSLVALICMTGLLLAGSASPGSAYKAATFNDDNLSFCASANFNDGSESTPNCTLNPQGPGTNARTLVEPLPNSVNSLLPTTEWAASYSSPQNSSEGVPPRSNYPAGRSFYPPPHFVTPPYFPPRPDNPPPPSSTPEPATMLILGLGAAAAVPFMRRKK